ncbi:MAG: hypothetical protein ACRDKG_08820, partial [Actinomycetota bacterium]
ASVDYLRSEYVEIVGRWNELSSKRDVLLEQLKIFEDTRGDIPPSVGELHIRQQLAEILDESLQLAHRGSQMAEMRQLFRKAGGRRAMLRNQQHWFQNIKELRATRLAL